MNKSFSIARAAAGGCVAALGAGLLVNAQAVGEGVRQGLATCANVLIPSLFPFMVLSGLLSLTALGEIVSAPLGPVVKRLFRLPADLGAVVLLGLIGGYPVGAKSIAGLLEQKRIDKETASRMLCFCVNSGPSFLITAVGAGMFLQRRAGVILFATQTAATLIIGIAVSLRVAPVTQSRARVYQKGPGAFVMAVSGAANAMLVLCAFAVLFSGLLSLVAKSGVPGWLARTAYLEEGLVTAVISGVFEVTAGCVQASSLGGATGFGLVSVFVSFSGLSVLFQIMSCFGNTPVSFRPLLFSRLVHGVLSTAMALPLYEKFCAHSPAWLAGQPPEMAADSKTWLISLCLLAMCTILALAVPSRPKEAKQRIAKKAHMR